MCSIPVMHGIFQQDLTEILSTGVKLQYGSLTVGPDYFNNISFLLFHLERYDGDGRRRAFSGDPGLLCRDDVYRSYLFHCHDCKQWLAVRSLL